MTTDYSSPESQIPDFPHGDAARGGGATQLDPEETSVQNASPGSFRLFATSGCRPAVEWADRVYQRLDTADDGHRAAGLIGCRSVAWFVRHSQTGEIRVASSKCKLRWCPLCIKSRQYVIVLAAIGWLANLDRPKMLTLTLKHTNAPLSAQIKKLYDNFREYRRRPAIKKLLRGGIWFFQIKRSKESGQWHPHLHILLDSKFVPKEILSQKWLETTKSSNIIDIRAISDKRKAAEYVARYAAAPCRLIDYSLEDAVEIVQAMHGLRIVGAFGTARGVKLTAQRPDDADAWQRLDDFKNVALSRHFDPDAAAIWQAWVKNEPCAVLPKEPQPPPDIKTECFTEPPISYRQLVFQFKQAI